MTWLPRWLIVAGCCVVALAFCWPDDAVRRSHPVRSAVTSAVLVAGVLIAAAALVVWPS